tara:strand:+ start:185 stop:712 length:528 start_codon:yes stop_codon:yes gene_type:complete
MIVTNSETFRTNITKRINEYIKNDALSQNIEKGIYNFAIKASKNKKVVKKWDNEYFVQIYIDRFRSIWNNTNPKIKNYNKQLLSDIKSGKITPKRLESITHQEMNFEIWQSIIEDKIKREKSLVEDGMSAATDEFVCGKCKNRKCVYYQIQIRSSDEPMTTFVSCLVCSNRFKIG